MSSAMSRARAAAWRPAGARKRSVDQAPPFRHATGEGACGVQIAEPTSCRSPNSTIAHTRLAGLPTTEQRTDSLVVAPKPEYIPRVVDAELRAGLSEPWAVLIQGAKGVGKTETASHLAASKVLLDVDQEARAAAAIDPSLVLSGARPRLIDEWQEVPAIWNHVRGAVELEVEGRQLLPRY